MNIMRMFIVRALPGITDYYIIICGCDVSIFVGLWLDDNGTWIFGTQCDGRLLYSVVPLKLNTIVVFIIIITICYPSIDLTGLSFTFTLNLYPSKNKKISTHMTLPRHHSAINTNFLPKHITSA